MSQSTCNSNALSLLLVLTECLTDRGVSDHEGDHQEDKSDEGQSK